MEETKQNDISIYQKISIIQENLLKHEFGTKKGFHGDFIPLKEMLPPVMRECRNQELTLYFTSTADQFILKLMSWDKKEEFSARVRLPELTRDEKDEGKKITYLKRYLLMDTFQILEDSFDPDSEEPERITVNDLISEEPTGEVVAETVTNDPPIITRIKKECMERDQKPTKAMIQKIRKEWFLNKEINTEENKIVNEYTKAMV